MERVLRLARIPPAEVAAGLGISPRGLARFLDGTELPSRLLLERFARTCGADPTVLLLVREDQRRRTGV
ncbi:MAG TPA: XRE family transcriptional regulator [Streptomyces sp.]|uniref:helix-turn-helix domain-containing protein n=2 Tax=Streptomyces TaxID=1883 RepID=UPI000364B4DC|nr:helix-turn-helix transcriptional regulator [Streptomyces sp. SID3915]MYR67440.1 XRE family transcriptional regulator [Streptomyces sp. SID4939]MYT61939.1 XRE family transcriptional regulator [Streptomyces sp. SID8357]MYT85309.1 XRE family transcriptional regulator [Streptomyces sp. SID8360]MYU36423.1 XRE family transcriptional regulator [Streptomyces sp. SID8358]MYW38996.1 XRE family transcriptional regulator [Streptomyces sp. SID1]HBF78500.1 XRE family transcriptional regulator [Streptomy